MVPYVNAEHQCECRGFFKKMSYDILIMCVLCQK